MDVEGVIAIVKWWRRIFIWRYIHMKSVLFLSRFVTILAMFGCFCQCRVSSEKCVFVFKQRVRRNDDVIAKIEMYFHEIVIVFV